MAILYVRSTDGNNADNGSTWALAKATLAGALSAAAAGDTIYVSQSHAETQGSNMTLTSPGTAASPCKVICVNDGAQPPTESATTATVTTTGATTIAFVGFGVVYGITFSATSGTSTGNVTFSNANPWAWVLESCAVKLAGTSGSSRIDIGAASNGDDQVLRWKNTTCSFGSASQKIIAAARFEWVNTPSAVAGTAPTALFGAIANRPGAAATIMAVDLSTVGSGSSLVDGSDARGNHYRFIDCKLGSSVAVMSGTHPGQGGSIVELINCDSADTNYRFYRQNYEATEQHETTVVRTGGTSDGTTTVSRKIVTTANVSTWKPYETQPVTLWCAAVSTTITIPVLTDGVTLTDAEAWLEVEYLGTSGNPLGVIASDRVSDFIFGTPANQTTDSTSTWTTTGLSSPVKQELSVTFTPQKAGLVRARVCVAKASTTVYYDPKILSTSGRQYLSESGVVNEGASSSSSTGVSRSRVVNC